MLDYLLLLAAGALQGVMVSLNAQLGKYYSLFAICFFVQIAFLQHHFRVGLELRLGQIVRHGRDHGRPLGKKKSGWPPAGGKSARWIDRLHRPGGLEPRGESPLYAFPWGK